MGLQIHSHIALVDEAKPFCVKTPRTIPYVYREKLEADLKSLEEQGIMCAPIVVAPKKGTDDIRMCIDLSHLNRYHITLYLSRYIERNIHFANKTDIRT